MTRCIFCHKRLWWWQHYGFLNPADLPDPLYLPDGPEWTAVRLPALMETLTSLGYQVVRDDWRWHTRCKWGKVTEW